MRYGLKNDQLAKSDCNKKQQLDYATLEEYSEYLMDNNFTDIKTRLDHIRKSLNGYTIHRFNSNYKYMIHLNLINNQIELKRSI